MLETNMKAWSPSWVLVSLIHGFTGEHEWEWQVSWMHAVFTEFRWNRPKGSIPCLMSLRHPMQPIWTSKSCHTVILHHWHCQNTAWLPNDCHFHWFSHFPETRRFLVSFHLFTYFHFAFTFCIPNSIGMLPFTHFRWMPFHTWFDWQLGSFFTLLLLSRY